jgi:hypothetical protein
MGRAAPPAHCFPALCATPLTRADVPLNRYHFPQNHAGARFATPSGPMVDSQAMGRGTTTAVNSL